MTLDADLTVDDAGLRKTCLGTDSHPMGQRIGHHVKTAKAEGGTVCTIQGNPGADNILRRAQGFRDALSGQEGLAALAGEGDWTEVAGCPVFTNLVTALVGQRPFEMGYLAPGTMIALIKGLAMADPIFTDLNECTRDTVDTCIQKGWFDTSVGCPVMPGTLFIP